MNPVASGLEQVPDDLWLRAEAAPRRALMLDYDGTLAPFSADRSRAFPAPGALPALRLLASSRGTTVAIVSGRPIDELSRLLDGLPVRMEGVHGWESLHPGREIVRRPLPAASAAALELAERLAREAGFGEQLESKHGAIVAHTRRLREELARVVEESIRKLWRIDDDEAFLILRRIHGGLELRARARHKGHAVREIMDAEPPGTFGVYIGDDETDEDAFEEISKDGMALRVGDPTHPGAVLGAGGLPNPEGVVTFLERWQSVIEGLPQPEAAPL